MSLLRRGARVAAISSIHGNVQRRQQGRWAAQDQAQATRAPAPPSPPPVTVAATGPADATSPAQTIELLRGLGDLHAAGVLTDEEFAAQKARLLA